MCVGKLGKVILNFFHELVLLEDLEVQELKVLECRKLSMQALFGFLVLGDSLGLSGTTEKKKMDSL